jgi:hypothetical protein
LFSEGARHSAFFSARGGAAQHLRRSGVALVLFPRASDLTTAVGMTLLTVGFLLSMASAAFDVAVTVGSAHAYTSVTSLTSVTMDVCVAKQRFPFDNRDLLGLTSHLGGGNSILRIGGSDQNSFYYDMDSTKTETYR